MYNFRNIWLDPGHYAGANVDPRNPHYSEGDAMLKLGLRIKQAFAAKGIEINLTREDGRDVSFENRGKKAAGADLFISLHTDYPANDTLIFYPLSKPEDKAMAENIGQTVAKHLGVGFRGARARVYPNVPNKDYYAVMRAALKYGAKHVFLLEHCGHAQMAIDTDKKIEKIVQAYLELFDGGQEQMANQPNQYIIGIQAALRDHGIDVGAVDGIPGPKTLAGVREAVNRMTLAERELNKLKGTNTDARLEKAKTLAKQILEV
jgi:hypothetical protein